MPTTNIYIYIYIYIHIFGANQILNKPISQQEPYTWGKKSFILHRGDEQTQI